MAYLLLASLISIYMLSSILCQKKLSESEITQNRKNATIFFQQKLNYTILTEGDNETYFEKGDTIVFKYIGYTKEMKEFTRQDKPIHYDFTKNEKPKTPDHITQVLPCFTYILPTMSYQEKGLFFCPYQLAHREHVMPGVGSFANTYFEVTIVDIYDQHGTSKARRQRRKISGLKSFKTKEDLFRFFKVEFLEHGDSNSTLKACYGDNILFHFKGYIAKTKRIFEISDEDDKPLNSMMGLEDYYFRKCHELLLPHLNIGDRIKFFCPARYAFGLLRPNRLIKPNTHLEYEFKLVGINKNAMSYNDLDTLAGREKAFKIKYLYPGDKKNFPDYGDYVVLYYKMYLVFDVSDLGNIKLLDESSVKFVFIPGSLIKCQEINLIHMSLGEKIRIYCPYLFGYGYDSPNDKVDAKSNLVYELELKQIDRKDDTKTDL